MPKLGNARLVSTTRVLVCAALGCVCMVLSQSCTAAANEQRHAAARERINLDRGWHAHLGEASGAEAPSFDDTTWRTVELPHDFGMEGEYRADNPDKGACGYLPGNIAWYRHSIKVTADDIAQHGHVAVEIDGASRYSRVWINGHFLGERPSAFISFSYDLTPYLQPGQNVLAVRVDTTAMPAARWYIGTGLYGHVNLVLTNPVHVPQWGTFITTPRADTHGADVQLTTTIANDTDSTSSIRLTTALQDNQQNTVGNLGEMSGLVSPHSRAEFFQTGSIANPSLWSPDNPRLYRAVTRVLAGGNEVDTYQTPFGVRTLRWDANTGFWLNGQNTKLKGVAMHYDGGGGIGMAIPDSLLDFRMRLLKSMGTNAIRTGHTPYPPKFYEICDRLGIMVMDEPFDGWRKKVAHDYGADSFAEWWKRDLTDFVLRDRNHPCVFMWSIGNETGDTDKYGMTQVIHALDPTRASTGGQVLHGVDVAGFNGPGEVAGVLEKFHTQNPEVPIVLTEEPHGYQTRGFYRTLTWWRDNNPNARVLFPPYSDHEVFTYGGDPQYCSSYDNALVRITNRQCWKRTRDTPWISGQFRWAAFDYIGEAQWSSRHWPARFWHPGILDAAAIPKDIYYFYQSQWTTAPMVHLLPQWTHPLVGEGTPIPVVAYSNCDEVELLLNGTSLGRQKESELLEFLWHVPYRPGTLEAIGYKNGRQAARQVIRTAGDEWHLKLETPNLPPDRIAMITASVVDANGELVPHANSRIDFKETGAAHEMGWENGDCTDVSQHTLPHRKAFAGIARGYYRVDDTSAPAELTAAAVLGNSPFQSSTTVSLVFQRLALQGDLAPASCEIRYTTDGSPPGANSARYTAPFALDHAATVTMLVLRDGTPFMQSGGAVEKGLPPIFDDPHYERPATSTTISFPSGPHDKELVGWWKAGNRTLHFREDGAVLRVENTTETQVARWWYNFPDDPFEDKTAVGAGELLWLNNSAISRLQLTSPAAASSLVLQTGNKSTTFNKSSR